MDKLLGDVAEDRERILQGKTNNLRKSHVICYVKVERG